MTDSTQTQQSIPPAPSDREARLGDVLQQARQAKGLELSDIAEMTHVRKEYLKALDEARYKDLPEDVYTKNFLRLYGQALGLDYAKLLELYKRERHAPTEEVSAQDAAATASAPEVSRQHPPAAPADAPAPATRSSPKAAPWARFPSMGGLLPSLLVVALLVWGALWAFNNLLFPASPPPAQAEQPAEAATTATAADEPTAAATTSALADSTILFSLSSDPPGAEVSLDNYDFPGTTPIENAPVSPGEGRMLRVALEGYETFEREIDLTFNRNLSVALSPVEEAFEPGPDAEGAGGDAAAAVAADGQIALTIVADSWLEAYSGTGRGQGQTLIYRNAEPGESFAFDLPVYLHVGNGGGVLYSIGGQDQGPLGSSGEIVSRAFEAD